MSAAANVIPMAPSPGAQMSGITPKVIKTKMVDSFTAFGVKFGKANDISKPIPGYEGYTKDDGVPEIDPDYVFQNVVTRDFLMGATSGGRIYMSGPTGSGKTTLPEQFAAHMGRPFERVQFSREMEPNELTGLWTIGQDGKMTYLYSGLARALTMPSVIVFDEFDSGNAAVTAIANAVLEGKPLVLNNKGGEKIIPHPDALLFGTGNTTGMGDDTGLYASTSVQSYATMNRWQMHLQVGYLSEADERLMMKKKYGTKGMPEAEIIKMVACCKAIRDSYTAGNITCPISTRQLIAWGKWLGMCSAHKRSFALAFANQLGKTDRATVDQIFQRIFGDS